MSDLHRSWIASAFVSALALAGCGGSSSDGADDRSQGRDTAAVAPAQWAQDVCTGVGGWSAGIEAAAAQVPAALGPAPDLTVGKRAVLGFLTTAVEGTEALLSALDDAGIPDVGDGADVSAAIRDGIAGVRDGLTVARTTAETLPADDPAGFQAGVDAVREAIRGATAAAGDALNEAVAEFEARRLDEALRAEPTCQTLAEYQPFADEVVPATAAAPATAR